MKYLIPIALGAAALLTFSACESDEGPTVQSTTTTTETSSLRPVTGAATTTTETLRY